MTVQTEDFDQRNQPSSTAPGPVGNEPAGDSLELMARLGFLAERIYRPRTSSSRVAAIQIAREMLLTLIDSVSGNIGEVLSESEREKLGALGEQLDQSEKFAGRETWAEFFGIPTTFRDRQTEAYDALKPELVRSFRTLFTVIESSIENADDAAEFAELHRTLLEEFESRW